MSDIAWAAGLFEGEGSCFVGTKGNCQPVVALVMTDEEIVRRFYNVIGYGTVRYYEQRNERHAPYWRWSVQSQRDVLAVLDMLWSFLGSRRQEAAMEVIERAVKMNDGEGFCKNGHDLADPTHRYFHKKSGKRHCRTCRREYKKGWVLRRVGSR